MSPTIRFITAVFLAQTFVNAVAVPNPHIHRVLDARQAAALPVVARQETVEPDAKNVFDAIIDTLEGYNGWQVFQDFFRKLFAGPDEDSDDGAEVTPPVIIVPGPSSSPVDVISVIESIISEVAETTPVVVIPTEVPVVSESDGIMSILPIFPVTTAVDLSFTGEPAVPTELLPETTEIPVIVLPSYGPSETVALPAENGTIVASLPGTEPVVVVIPTDLPVEANTTATEAPVVVVIPTDLPVEANVTAPGTEPVVVVIPTDLPLEANTTATEVPVIVIPTDISSPVEINGTASAGAEVNVTISATVIVAPIATGTDVGTILPITISSEEAPFANTTDVITPTLIIVTGTGEPVATIEPTISAPFANDTEATAAPVGTSAIIIGSGVVAPSGTEVVISVEPIETIIIETAPIVTGTGDVTAVVPIGTALPLFPNGTEVVVEPTIVVPDGTAPVVSAVPLPSPIDEPSFANTTTTTVTNVITPSADIETAVETLQAPAGTIVVVPGPDVVFPNVTITVNGSEATLPVTLPTLDVDATEAPVVTIDIGTLAPALSIGTEFPAIPIVTVDESVIASATFVPIDTLLPVVTDLPIIPVDTALPIGTDLPVIPVIPIDTLLPVVPVDTALPTEIVPTDTLLPVVPVETVEPIPTDAPVVEFPGLLALRSICRDPTVRQLTLPILNRFYGPSAYPSLFSFPGCLSSNDRQTIQAPGLLNCTALGTEVQTCQSSGRRVLLSVKADGLGAVGGNADFGDPNSDAAPWGGYFANGTAQAGVYFPNLFDERHVPSAFALTLFSLFGEGTTERADLRPLGPETPSEDGVSWVDRPLGEEVVVDGFDVQLPRNWEGTYQERRFDAFVNRLGELNEEAWRKSGSKRGGPNDLGVDGKGVVFRGWNKRRSVQRVVMIGGFEVLVE